MKINSFKAEGVHGYLKFELTFYSELTFLIGINGSGKTSAIKLILGLTSPSFHYLNQIDFDFCEVVCSSQENEKDILIRAVQDKKNQTFIISVKSKKKEYISEPIKRLLKEDTHYDAEEFQIKEQGYKDNFDTLKETKEIRELATPKFLGLDRKIYEGRFIDHRFHNRARNNFFSRKRSFNEGTSAIDSSLEEVQALIYEYIRKTAKRQPQISEEFKRKIFKQTFSFTSDYNLDPIPDTIEDLKERKEKVLTAVKNLGIDYLNLDVNNYFSEIEKIVNENISYKKKQEFNDSEDELINDEFLNIMRAWFNNGPQLRRIDEIINYSKQYQQQITKLRTPIKKLEDIASDFLKEGGKSLIISSDGEIKVKLGAKKIANVFELSSGEKQIIIMIAHLIFEEAQKPSGIFIIDEPELSLHLAWQEIFVDSITKASPKTQFILATHSPSIISKVKRERFCQDLNKLNVI